MNMYDVIIIYRLVKWDDFGTMILSKFLRYTDALGMPEAAIHSLSPP